MTVTKPSAARSRQMSLVKGKGNKSTEEKVLRLLRKRNIWGWRRHPELPGRPDFAFMQEKLAVFLDGCFWHGCPNCSRRAPRTNASFWAGKLNENLERDRRVSRELRGRGWRVLRIWEHALQ